MILILFTSCLEEQSEILETQQQDTKLTLVKNWFEANKSELRVEDSRDNFRTEFNELILPFFEKEPDWDKFHIFQFPDGREVYEISLANTEMIFPTYLADSLSGVQPSNAVIQNIMFVENKENNRFDPVIARYYPDNKNSVREFDEIFYDMIDINWSGTVDIWTYDERHFIGFIIRQGEITSTIRHDAGGGEGSKLTNEHNLFTVDCFRVPTTVTYTYTTTGYYETTVEATQHYTTICSGSGGSSGSGSGGFVGTTYDYNDNLGGSGSYGAVGGTTYTPPTISSPTIKIEKIDMEDLDDCHQDIINDLIGSTQQEFHRIFRKFYGDKPLPLNYNVKFQYGVCEGFPGATACNSPHLNNGWATITLNPSVNSQATDLSIARTILHEMLHAYLLFEEKYPSNCDLNCLLNNYLNKYNGYNSAHHTLFVETKFLNDIETELKNYALSVGYNINVLGSQFFKDMAWGGLHETDVFKKKSTSEQNRINNRVNSELMNKLIGASLPLGTKACE